MVGANDVGLIDVVDIDKAGNSGGDESNGKSHLERMVAEEDLGIAANRACAVFGEVPMMLEDMGRLEAMRCCCEDRGSAKEGVDAS